MDAAAWDKRYDTSELVWTSSPNRFLVEQFADLPAGTVLDLACGEGRNAISLAENGWQITGVDFSPKGIEKAKQLAAARKVEGRWIVADATTWTPDQTYDAVILFYLQLPQPEIAKAMQVALSALANGGTLLLVAHDLRNLAEGHGGPQDPSVLMTAEQIIDYVTAAEIASDFEIVVEQAGVVERPVETDDGTHIALDTLVRLRRVA